MADQKKAPERVYGFLEPDQGGMRWEFSTHPDEADTEYVRADLHDALAKERYGLRAEVERLQRKRAEDAAFLNAQMHRAEKAEAEVERLREIISVELEEARRIADADLESQAAMERVMDYPMERTYTPAMKRFDRLNAALHRKEGNE